MAGSYDPAAQHQTPPNSASLRIRLQQAWFDPLVESPAWPAALIADELREDGPGYHLVQFRGPILTEWRELIEQAGGEILDYVPDYAFIVRIDAQQRADLFSAPEIRWSGLYSPAFRLQNTLLDRLVDGGRLDPDEVMALSVRAFPGEPVENLTVRLSELGAGVTNRGHDSGGGVIFRIDLPASSIADLANIPAVAWIEPVMEMAWGNQIARGDSLLRKNLVEQSLGYFGQDQMVAVIDSGLSTGNVNTVHQDFTGRVAGTGFWPGNGCDTWADNDSHGTHVAGSVLGSGIASGANPSASQYAGSNAGIAPEALLVVWGGCNDLGGIPAHDIYNLLWSPLYNFDARLRVHNNSWGQTSEQTFGTYNTPARETDRFVRDFPDMVGVFISHNSGLDSNSSGVVDFGTVTPPGTAKNVITVGASENLRATGGFNPGSPVCFSWGSCWGNNFPVNPIASDQPSDHANGMAAFSGRGPTLSNRLKPDIVAPGTNIVSARNENVGTGWGVYNSLYLYQGGTSMAAPLVAGGAAIVREYFNDRFSHNPSAALVKAVLINAARDMSPGQHGQGQHQDVWARPDINQGWGRMDLANTVIFSGARRPTYFEASPGFNTGQMGEETILIGSAGSELRITLVWTDMHGLEASHGALVNDLDLEVVDPSGIIHFGFAGLAGQQRDRFNNFEEVRFPAASAGQYVVRVIGHNVPSGPQPFALAITGALDVDGRIFQDRFAQPSP